MKKVVFFSTALVALTPAAAGAATTGGSPPSTLSVMGNGTVHVAPDRASVDVDIVKHAGSSRAALSAANSRTGAISAALVRLGIPKKGIQTSGLDVSRATRVVGTRGHRHKVRDWTATESLHVSSTAAQAGPVIDTSVAHGASNTTNLNFSFSDPSAGVSAANGRALSDARAQADAAAKQLGYTVTGVQSVDLDPEDDSGSGSGTASAGTSAPAKAAPQSGPVKKPTNVHPGTQEVDAQVQVVFTIAPAS